MKNFFKKIKNKNEMLNEGLANDNRVYNEIGNVGNVVNSGALGDFGNVNMPKFGMMGSNPIMNEISKQTDIPQMNNDMLSNSNSYKPKTEDNNMLSSVDGFQPVENKVKPLGDINISVPVEQPKISEDLRNFATELVNKNNVRTIQNMMEMANNYLSANNIKSSNTEADNNYMLSKMRMPLINPKDLTEPDYFSNHPVAKNQPVQQSNLPTGYASPVESEEPRYNLNNYPYEKLLSGYITNEPTVEDYYNDVALNDEWMLPMILSGGKIGPNTINKIKEYGPYLKDIWAGRDIIFAKTPTNRFTKEFEKLKQLGLEYYKNYLQKHPVNIKDYGEVNFGRHNRGKDDTIDYKQYPFLRKNLESSKKDISTNNKNEADRYYDHRENTHKGNLYDYIIEVIEDKGKRYKMMKNKNKK